MQIGRNVLDGDVHALIFSGPVHRLHGHQVDDALEVVAEADWNLDRDGVCAKASAERLEAEVKVSTKLVHLVDQAHARHAVTVGLAPHGFGLRFNAFLAVEHCHCAIEHAERALHFDGEVNVSRGVDQIDLVIIATEGVRASGCSTLDGDAALLLFLQAVHGGGAFMHFTDLVDLACVEKNALSDGGLTSVDVGADSDIANLIEVNGHWSLSVEVGEKKLDWGGYRGVADATSRKAVRVLSAALAGANQGFVRNAQCASGGAHLFHPASAVLNIARGWLEFRHMVCKERVHAAHVQFAGELGGHGSEGDWQVAPLAAKLKADGDAVRRRGAPADRWKLQAIARERVGFIDDPNARFRKACLQRFAVTGASALAVEGDPRVDSMFNRGNAHAFNMAHRGHEVDGGFVGDLRRLRVELARVNGTNAQFQARHVALGQRGAQHACGDTQGGRIVPNRKRQGFRMPRITDRRQCRRRAECRKQGGIGLPCAGRTGARGCKRTHAALKMAQWMTNRIFRALEFFAVFNRDAMSTVGRGATHRGCKRAPQAGRADVRQGRFAHFGQHKHRAAHAEWAKQRAVAGFVDACVEEWHVGEGTGKVCSKPLKWA